MIVARIFVKFIAPDIKIRKTTDGSAFEWTTNTLYYNQTQDAQDVGFLRHVEEQHFFPNPTRYKMALWSLLHELGHHFNEDVEPDETAKAIAALIPYETAQQYSALQDMYYNSPDEFAATEWAIDWISSHPFLSVVLSALL